MKRTVLLLFLLFTGTAALAQNLLKGTVSDEQGPLAGAAVTIAGTTRGATTDIDGNFVIDCEPGTILEVIYIGYASQSLPAKDGMMIILQEDSQFMEEVVVTALGIKRERKALGYGVAEVKGEDLTKAKETNVINSLAGKVAGLVVNQTAGGPAGSTRVMLRGNTEMTGDNQPLYVIDGVPLDNTNFGAAGTAGGFDLGDGISAVNPDDIETMTVLKGPAASALYGSRASHGVIMITTKKAEKQNKFSAEYNGTFTADTQLAKWDSIQQVYGMGYNGQYAPTAVSGTNSSWGPKADDVPVTYFDGVTRPFYMYPDNTSAFFRTGFTAQNTAILSATIGKTGIRASLTDLRNSDILPNTGMSRDNVSLRVNSSISKLDLDFSANYTREDVKNRPALGDSQSNVGKNLMTLAGTYNQEWLKNYQTATGEYANWNGNDQYNKNPYWDLYKNHNLSTKDVLRLTGKAVWNFSKLLRVQGTVGTDINRMDFEEYSARTTPGRAAGQMQQKFFNNRTLNAEILALYNANWDRFDFNATAGANMFKVNNETSIINALGEPVGGASSIDDFAEKDSDRDTYCKQINSAFASASIGFDHTYYLEATLRADQSSTLPVENNLYVYPSVSASWVFSELVRTRWFDYGKLRASWAVVGSDTDPYRTGLYYDTGIYTYPGHTIGQTSQVMPNKHLKPTMTTSWEVGLETKFLKNRVSVDFTYYDQISRDQIMTMASSSASGYPYRLINAGAIRNNGVELAINGRVIHSSKFAWDAGVNFSKNNNKVLELVDGIDYFEIEKALWCNVSVGAKKGENFGAIMGPDVVRNEEGKVVINAETGLPEFDSTLHTLGNSSWDWTGGFYHTFTFGDFRLSAAFDVKWGADVFSMSMRSAYETGRALETLEGRAEWYASEEARLAAGKTLASWRASGKANGLIVDGVIRKSDGTYKPNNIPVNPESYWKAMASSAPGTFIYDNSYIKCREITFGYNFPEKMLGKHIKGLNLSFVARNPFIIWKSIPNIDPDSGYNTSGFGLEYGSLPSRKSFGFNVNVKF